MLKLTFLRLRRQLCTADASLLTAQLDYIELFSLENQIIQLDVIEYDGS